MRIACCLVVVTGCTTIDDGFGIHIEARDAPVVVVRDGDGPWERLVTTPDGRAHSQIFSGAYGVGRLCNDELYKSASFIFDTQPRTVFLPCPITTAAKALHVRGTTEPAATVWIDNRSVRADASGAYDLTLYEPGLHDLIAILPTTPPRIVGHRAIAITGDTIVDLPASGAIEMTAVYPTIAGDPGAFEVSSDLNTGTDWVSLGSSPSMVYVPPSTFLVPTDRPAIAVRASGCTRQHPLSAANEPFELPAPLDYTLDRSQFAWTADPAVAWDTSLLQIDNSGTTYSAYASASWREVTELSTIPIVDLEALPGWTGSLPRLVIDKPAWFNFYISRGRYDGDLTSCSVTEDLDRW